jgi:predicted MPP superfamily phosphohydrolase
MNKTLTWLHLSDLHLTCKGKDTDWTLKSINQDIVIHSLLDAIDKLLIKKGQKPDIIFITGDLTHSAKKDEYEIAEVFCEKLLEITGVDKENLFIIPGNHDVNRQEVKPLHTKSWYQFNNQDSVSEILSDSDMSSILFRKLDGFYQFSNNFLGLDCKPEQHYIIAKPIEIKNTPYKINLLGLNSALFAGYNGDDEQKLAFGLHQIKEALQILDENHLTIAFFIIHLIAFTNVKNLFKTKLNKKLI